MIRTHAVSIVWFLCAGVILLETPARTSRFASVEINDAFQFEDEQVAGWMKQSSSTKRQDEDQNNQMDEEKKYMDNNDDDEQTRGKGENVQTKEADKVQIENKEKQAGSGNNARSSSDQPCTSTTNGVTRPCDAATRDNLASMAASARSGGGLGRLGMKMPFRR
jgi:hypothetical protein